MTVISYPVPIDILQQKITDSLEGTHCSKIWLGYAEVMFIGFDSEALVNSKEEYRPPFEFHTHYADWFFERDGRMVVTNSDFRDVIIAETKDVLDKKVVNWRYEEENYSLKIEFEQTWRLSIKPWSAPIVKSNEPTPDAWVLRVSSEGYYSIDCNGNKSFQPLAPE